MQFSKRLILKALFLFNCTVAMTLTPEVYLIKANCSQYDIIQIIIIRKKTWLIENKYSWLITIPDWFTSVTLIRLQFFTLLLSRCYMDPQAA